jgi:multidrug transporter EmrE-like cation transporter
MRIHDRFRRSKETRKAAYVFLVLVASSAIAAIVGPFSTFDTMPLDVRFVYWGGIIGSSAIVGTSIRKLVERFPMKSPIQTDLTVSAIMAPTFGFAITVFNAKVIERDTDMANAVWLNILVVLLVCFGVAVFRAYIRHLSAERRSSTAAPLPDAPSGTVPGFLREIETEIGRTVRWIEADDHYLRIHGPVGSARVLMRFRDALDEVSHLPGLRVHRSHWIHVDAVTEVRPDGRRHIAVLNCGAEVPVSRSYLGNLETAGLLPDDAALARRSVASRGESPSRLRP